MIVAGGEDELRGRWVSFKGRRTMRAIRMRLKKERCHGWAMALIRFKYQPSTGKAESGYWVDLESGQYHWDIRYRNL